MCASILTVNGHLLLQSLHKVVKQADISVSAGLGVNDIVEAGDLEPVGVAPLSFVHVVSKGQHDLKQLLELLAHHDLSTGTQDSLHLGSCVIQTVHKSLLEVQTLQPLAIVRDPGQREDVTVSSCHSASHSEKVLATDAPGTELFYSTS